MDDPEGRLSERLVSDVEAQVAYYPIDWKAIDEAKSQANKDAHAQQRALMNGQYQLPTEVLSRAHAVLAGASRKARRKLHRDLAELNLLAVLDPASGATTRDRLDAARESARIAGLARESTSVVEHRVTFRGLAGSPPAREVIEAKVVEAAGLPPIASQPALPSVPPSGGPSDGAAGDPRGA